MAYVTIVAEGGFFPAELLEEIAQGRGEGQRPSDFGPDVTRLSDEIQAAFSDARAFHEAYKRRRARSRESAVTLTREFWMSPFLERLGYDLVYQRAGALIGGESYTISHRAGDDPEAPPVHIVADTQDLDRRDGARRSPHALVQEYLNRSDALWGLVTNGERLRLLRDSARTSTEGPRGSDGAPTPSSRSTSTARTPSGGSSPTASGSDSCVTRSGRRGPPTSSST